MIVAVASGKGGTGKTMIATNLAVSLKDNMPVQLLDCDVEEPNTHLFIDYEQIFSEDVMLPIPSINQAKCNHCGICVQSCAFNALADIKVNLLVFEELCHGCGGCSLLCPTGAITQTYKKIGVVKKGHADGMGYIHGLLDVGAVLTPPVINKVKTHIKSDTAVIIDAPPGTSCPMINAVNGADYCILVTEPTPFGLNDLKLAVEVVRELDIPFGVIINRAGAEYPDMTNYLLRQDIPLLMSIPFKRQYASCYAEGKLLVDEFPQLQEDFKKMWQTIERRVKA
ncbi:MAG: P-loop NTPase [Thermoanaerobacteraceae bacterium]|nr:P-loop NTPase [Thermoanaerobacteraceae bacterium]